jgi:hypothetical protein
MSKARKTLATSCLVILFATLAVGTSFADKKNLQVAQPASATNQPDSSAVGDYQDMPALDIRNPIDFMDSDGVPNPSNITVTPGAFPGVVSVANFSGSFVSGGKTFPFTMMGNDPALGRTTNIPTKIVAVDVVLLNADGTTFATVPTAPFENLVLHSPNFQRADYTVGHVQFADAVQRAEFFNHMKDNWHTNLTPATIVEHVTVTVPFQVNVRIRGVVTPVRTWFTRTSTDGNTVIFMLQQFFNGQFSNVGVNAINAGDWTTDAMNIELWPNTFLFTPSATPLVTRGPCCVLGFHTFFSDSSVTPEPVWVSAYASWTSPGTFTNTDILDVLPMSHEVSESFNDPFLNNATPRWTFPGEPGVCQGNLESGDPVEVTAHPAFPVKLNINGDDGNSQGGGDDQKFIFHPQTEALVQWFTQTAPSDAFKGAFSYPDVTTLPTPAVHCP